ncbi:hypothetical protein SHIRM173S_04006 [Streptomyces hirsutus]
MRASLLQVDVNEGESVESRRRRVAALVREQAGADLVVLPELWTTGAFAYEDFAREAEPLHGPTLEAMAAAARDAGVWLHAGSVPERAAADDGSAGGDGPPTTPRSSSPPPETWPPSTARSTASASTRARPS